LIVIEDQALENTTKALLTLYNATDEETISLVTAEKEIEIVTGVAPNKNSAREINAVEIDLAINTASGETITLEPLLMERKNAYSIIALKNTDGEFDHVVITAKTDTTK